MTGCTLGLFAKQPVPGTVKSRLAAQTSPAWAAEVAAAFLGDLADRLSRLNCRRVLVYAPAEAEPWFSNLAAGRFHLHAQCPGDLGRRLAHFLAAEIRAPGVRVVAVGADSPTLPLDYVEQAFRELQQADVVLGPATDGGYYLVGCARRLPPLFDAMSWGGPTVLLETVRRLAYDGTKLAVLPPWYDVDDLDAWSALCGHLAAWRCAGINPDVPRTEALAGQALTARGGRPGTASEGGK